MPAGSFFGTIQGKREQCGAIFTDLRHTAGFAPRAFQHKSTAQAGSPAFWTN